MESAPARVGPSPDVSRINTLGKATEVEPTNQRIESTPRVAATDSSAATITALRENFREAINSANERLSDRGASVNVSIDKDTNTVIVQVKDRETGETVRQIPPEAAMQVTRNIERLTGILVDKKV